MDPEEVRRISKIEILDEVEEWELIMVRPPHSILQYALVSWMMLRYWLGEVHSLCGLRWCQGSGSPPRIALAVAQAVWQCGISRIDKLIFVVPPLMFVCLLSFCFVFATFFSAGGCMALPLDDCMIV